MPGSIGSIGSIGCERSSAWICDFSSTHSTTACSGGWWYSPTTSTTLSTNSGSVDSLKVSTRCGLSPNLRQIRPIVDLLSPERAAIDVRDQCVAFPGVSSSVATTTASTCSTVIDGGRPVRSPRDKPAAPLADRRRMHAQQSGDLRVWRPVRACQHDLASLCQRLRRFRPPRPAQQRRPFLSSQPQLGLWPSSPCHRAKLNLSSEFQAQDTSLAAWT